MDRPIGNGEHRGVLARVAGRGYFPHQLSWLIDNPLRSLFISPRGLANRLPLSEGSSVLELGAGSGYFSVELAGRLPRGRLELVDLQPEMLAKAKRKIEKRGFCNVGYHVQDAGVGLPFPDQTFDVAVVVAVLGEVGHRARCLQSLYRTLRPGGVLAIHEHIPDPDRIHLAALRSLVETEDFVFRKRWGPLWNYTALFDRV
ncbi:MAG: class I SAM-dependent methyltransferase [Terriglobia bacterium]